MGFLFVYVLVTYFMGFIASIHSKHMPWFMFIISPVSVPVTLCFIYSKALNKTFGE